jgi:tetratricopeptide (TPR) repeat protein
MMKIKKTGIFFFLIAFCAVIHVNGQESYNYFTLEYFKQSLQCLVNGDYHNAINYCSQVLRREPNSAVTYTIRARAYYEIGDMPKAIEDCTQAIRIDRNNISAYSIRANAYAKADDKTRAVRDWQAVLRMNPENAEAKYNLELAEFTPQ